MGAVDASMLIAGDAEAGTTTPPSPFREVEASLLTADDAAGETLPSLLGVDASLPLAASDAAVPGADPKPAALPLGALIIRVSTSNSDTTLPLLPSPRSEDPARGFSGGKPLDDPGPPEDSEVMGLDPPARDALPRLPLPP